MRRPASASSAPAPRSATFSCAARASLRSRLPKKISGSTTIGTTSSTMPASLALVISSSTSAPSIITALRRYCDTAEPTSDCSTAISAVMRARMSPVRAVSKNAGDRLMTWLNSSRRISAATRSPSQDTSV